MRQVLMHGDQHTTAGETNCSARSSMYSMVSTTWSPLLALQWLSKRSGTASHEISITRSGGRGFHTLTTVDSNLLSSLIVACFLVPKRARKKEHLASTVCTLISS